MMINDLFTYDYDESLYLERLRDNIDNKNSIQDFVIDREFESAMYDENSGLESYLKCDAWNDDEENNTKVFLIKSKKTNIIVAYFALKAGAIARGIMTESLIKQNQQYLAEKGIKRFPGVIPGIEISHFAVNDNYRKLTGVNKASYIGRYLYPKFIHPLIEEVANYIGVKLIYLFAADDDYRDGMSLSEIEQLKLIRYYREIFGFQTIDIADSIVPIREDYAFNSLFMYRRI